MSTVIEDLSKAGVVGGFIVTMIILAVFSIPDSFNTDGFENTSFSEFDNLTEYASLANQTATSTYDTTVDSSAFDVLGGLVVKSLQAVKTFFNSINFMQNSVVIMINSLGLKFAVDVIVTFVVTMLSLGLAGYFLFKVINKSEDGK